ncbi:hypothetical protein BIV57_00300 [Mangrovactinospora gilvigrisea]|uniref:Uncharacterized protein n=1 Tax=Mangrovactinospora gilvigrisea TaxID=1428644 RepID=A0A1J7BL65_9ACTN|nr:hypothetical protein [Mangrovactinospora gilvigrisea]OIV39325.1 hypothetical protein BIV57_00300 [Mangrovactinospora gilvigrisea]
MGEGVGRLVERQVVRALHFADPLDGAAGAGEFLGGRAGQVGGGHQRQRQVRADRRGEHAEAGDRIEVAQEVLHEPAAAQVHLVQRRFQLLETVRGKPVPWAAPTSDLAKSAGIWASALPGEAAAQQVAGAAASLRQPEEDIPTCGTVLTLCLPRSDPDGMRHRLRREGS